MRDYPESIAPVDHVEPVPRRLRGVLNGVTVFDTTRALYVWEWPKYPHYYIPSDDVDPEVVVDDAHRLGGARRLVRRGRARLRPPARPVHARRRGPLDATGAHRTRRSRARRVPVAGDGVRDGPADPLLPRPHRRPLRAPAALDDGLELPLQGSDDRLLVVRRRREGSQGCGLVVRLSHRTGPADRRPDRLLQRTGRRLPRRRAARRPTDALLLPKRSRMTTPPIADRARERVGVADAFEGTHALVTGAGRGIGRATALALAQAGANVSL